MITQLFYLVLFTSIIVLALKVAFSDEMVWEDVGKYGEQKIEEGRHIFKALTTCVYCMPTVYTSVSFLFTWLLGLLDKISILQGGVLYILSIGGSSIVCGTVWSVWGLINSATEYLDEAKGASVISKEYYEKARDNAHFDLKDRKERYRKSEKVNGHLQKVHHY